MEEINTFPTQLPSHSLLSLEQKFQNVHSQRHFSIYQSLPKLKLCKPSNMNIVYRSLSSATTPIMDGQPERRFGAAPPCGTGCPQKAAAGYPWSWPESDLAHAKECGEMVHVTPRREQDIIKSSAERNQRETIISISANEMRVGLRQITRAAQQAQPDHKRQLESQRDADTWSQ
jgi:hypothetical protein